MYNYISASSGNPNVIVSASFACCCRLDKSLPCLYNDHSLFGYHPRRIEFNRRIMNWRQMKFIAIFFLAE